MTAKTTLRAVSVQEGAPAPCNDRVDSGDPCKTSPLSVDDAEDVPSSSIKHSQSAHLLSPTAYSLPRLSPNFAKSREVFRLTGQRLLTEYGAKHIIVATLTFPNLVTSTKIAHGYLNSFLNALRKRYRAYLWVLEVHANGSIHYHILLATDADVYDGTNLGAFDARSDATPALKRRCMGPGLRAEADWLEHTAAAHGFGRIEAAPIYSEDPMAVIHYMMKCEWRFEPLPFDEKRYIRWWGCSRHIRGGTIRFSWVSDKARAFRAAMRRWALSALNISESDTVRISQLEENPFAALRRGVGCYWIRDFYRWFQGACPPLRETDV